MINKNIKIALAVALVATAIWQFSENYIGNGIFLLLLTAIIVLLYFKNELLIAVLFKFRKQDMEGASRILKKINPESHLIKNQQGYYYYLNGIITAQSNNLKESEKFFKKAIGGKYYDVYRMYYKRIYHPRGWEIYKKRFIAKN